MDFVEWSSDVTIADFYPGDMEVLNWLMRPQGTLEELANLLEVEADVVVARSKEIKILLHKTLQINDATKIKRGRLLEPLFRALDAQKYRYTKTKVTDQRGGTITHGVEENASPDHDIQLKAFMVLANLLGPGIQRVAQKELAEVYTFDQNLLEQGQGDGEHQDMFMDSLNRTFAGRKPKPALVIAEKKHA